MKFAKYLCAAAAALAVGATLVADPASAFEHRGDKKILVLVGREQVQIMDPSIKYDAKTRLMQQAMYDGLAKYVGNPPVITPWLATSWDVSDDGLTYTFHLADKAKFHNGDPVTAAAVKWSFERTLKLGKGPSWMLNEVLTPDNIKVIDDKTLSMTLSRPYAPFVSFIPWWYIMNPKVVMANEVDGDMGTKWMLSNEAGSGPFKLTRHEQGNLYELERVEDYWKPFNGPLGGVIYKIVRETSVQRSMLLKGDTDFALDLSPDEFEQARRMKGVVTSTEPALTAFGLKFNTKGKYTANRDLRKALAYAFDYEALEAIYNGRARLQSSPFTDSIKGHIKVPGMPRRDVAMAKAHLAKTPWSDGGIEIEYGYVSQLEEERQMGLILINSLKDLNIKVKITPLTWANLVARGSKAETSPDITAIFVTPVSTDPDAVAIQYHPSSWAAIGARTSTRTRK